MELTQEDIIVNDLIKRLQVFYLDVEALASQLNYVYQKYPHRIKDVKQALKGQLSTRLEKNLLLLAENQIIPEMVPDTSNVSEVLSHFPITEQQKYYDDKAKITTSDGQLNIFEMSDEQLKMVFDKKSAKVRTLPQQQSWLDIKTKFKSSKKSYSFAMVGNQKVINFTKNAQFTKDDLLKLINEFDKL